MLVGTNTITSTPIGGNSEGENPSNVYMMRSQIEVSTRSCDYGEPESSKAKTTPDVSELLHIERPIIESIPRMPKVSAKRSTINPNAKAA